MSLTSEASVYPSFYISWHYSYKSLPLFYTYLWLHLLHSTLRIHTFKTRAFGMFSAQPQWRFQISKLLLPHHDFCKDVSHQFRESKKDDEGDGFTSQWDELLERMLYKSKDFIFSTDCLTRTMPTAHWSQSIFVEQIIKIPKDGKILARHNGRDRFQTEQLKQRLGGGKGKEAVHLWPRAQDTCKQWEIRI